jgi:hydrogenase expression/formation protein HypC
MDMELPGRVLDPGTGPLRLARVAFGGEVREVSLALVPGARPGDYVQVHEGSATQILDGEAALEIRVLLEGRAGLPAEAP